MNRDTMSGPSMSEAMNRAISRAISRAPGNNWLGLVTLVWPHSCSSVGQLIVDLCSWPHSLLEVYALIGWEAMCGSTKRAMSRVMNREIESVMSILFD